jgi:hypothetical protein
VLTNDRQIAIQLMGCTRCPPSGIRVVPGQHVSVDLPENNNVLTMTAEGRATCFTVFSGLQPARVKHLLVSHAGACSAG